MDTNDEAKHSIHHQITRLVNNHRENDDLTVKQKNILRILRNDASMMVPLASKGRAKMIMDNTYSLQKVIVLIKDSEPC